jgi:hypothetical protein
LKICFYVLAIFLIFAGCERDLSGPTKDLDGLQITTEDEAFFISNRTDRVVRLFPVERETAAVILWAPYCLSTGLILQPGENRRIRFEEIYGYKKDCEVILYWWSCTEIEGRMEPGTIHSTVLSTSDANP